MSKLEQALSRLEEDWQIDPLLKDYILGRVTDVTDHVYASDGVTFHIPYLSSHDKYVLWKCYWPDCHNCCLNQGRLPLTSDDLITIGKSLKYDKTSKFIKEQTLVAAWQEPGASTTMTGINLKRRENETEDEDGTPISCRFLDGSGACSLHPGRPGVCYLYPFTTWLENDNGRARVHATFQFTGDCPGFYLADSVSDMFTILDEYAKIIYDYNMKYTRTVREGLGAAAFG